MADERYRKLLGIEPVGEVPTHYELLDIDRSERDDSIIEAAYKERMRALQQIRSSKDKGFLEFLKEELRTARLTLTNADRRKAYDESLLEDAVSAFKDWVRPMMALGRVPRGVYDTMVDKGVKDGLSKEHAARVIAELAEEHGATIELEGGEAAAPAARPAPAAVSRAGSSSDDEEPTFVDDLSPDAPSPIQSRPAPARPAARAAQAAPATQEEAPARRRVRRGGFWDDMSPGSSSDGGAAAPSAPWSRGGGAREGAAWSRGRDGAARRRPGENTSTQRMRWRNQSDQRTVSDARRLFNLGAKLAKVAGEVHDQLKYYFPPANGRSTITYQRNGVSYEKVFDTEQKTYRDSLKKFEAALEKVKDQEGAEAQELKSRAAHNITVIKGVLDEIRQHKLRQLAGLTQAEELRMWQAFVNNRRSSRLAQTISEK